MPGRSIRIFLIDGAASGLRTAELGLSTIKALVVPRASLGAAAKRPEIQKTGVYIIVGRDPEKAGTLKAYIGEGETVFSRLSVHDKEESKDFWEEAIVFTSKDENLTKAHIRYLESRLIALATEAKRCTLSNGTDPDWKGRLPEPDEVEMEEFLTQAQLLLGTLGYDLFKPFVSSPATSASIVGPPVAAVHKFKYSGDGFSASCFVDLEGGQFIVQKGSRARKLEAPSQGASYKNLRASLKDRGVLKDEAEGFVFSQDYAFSAITAAAQVVSGQTVSGRNVWRTEDDKMTFGEWQDSQIPQEPEST
jgi:hypothetical protein